MMQQYVKYFVDKDNLWTIKDCPCGERNKSTENDNIIKVGSVACKKCIHRVKRIKDYVYCNHPNAYKLLPTNKINLRR